MLPAEKKSPELSAVNSVVRSTQLADVSSSNADASPSHEDAKSGSESSKSAAVDNALKAVVSEVHAETSPEREREQTGKVATGKLGRGDVKDSSAAIVSGSEILAKVVDGEQQNIAALKRKIVDVQVRCVCVCMCVCCVCVCVCVYLCM
jgi:hypothetical protein